MTTRESNTSAVADFGRAVKDVLSKMSYQNTMSAKQASREHVLAVSRDFVSQPRLSKSFSIFLGPNWAKIARKLGGSSSNGRHRAGHMTKISSGF